MNILKAGRPSNLKEKAIAAVIEDTNVVSKITVNFPKILHKQLKQFAVEHDTTITQILIAAASNYMNKK